MLKLVCLSSLLVAACSSSGSTKSHNAANKQKGTASMVATYATTTKPANATSMGMMSSPPAGNVTIPITNVEVFVFTANVDDDDTGETLYWANDGDTVYVWGAIDLVCVDEDDVETGEEGTADFIYESGANGWGWMTATDSCGYSTLYGCSDDGTGEVCGGCDWNESFIACDAE